ncbi:MAG: 23S rRNA (guanosine(2251)-2'-O)-methyltransferase RlmB [Nitrospiraceae bacterium]|nr:23S rRNA (guanosine(2251)-2'-O)-methyltransferase RlmB [Nitrospiraceae bacterium]
MGGIHPVMELLIGKPDQVVHLYLRDDHHHDSRRREIIRSARAKGIPLDFLPAMALDRMAPRDSPHQGVLARVQEVSTFASVEDFLDGSPTWPPAPLVAVDGVQDPRNLGALLRTCDAAGVQGILLPKRRVAPLSGVTAKTSAGALFTLPLIRVGNLSMSLRTLKKEGYGVAVLDLEGEDLPEGRFPPPLVLVVGSEEKGVSRPVLELADWRIRLPMRGRVQSLNLSVAAGIFLYSQMAPDSR